MKVLHLLQSNRFSGAENVVFQIISMFKETDNVDMVYCSRDGQIREAAKEHGVNYVPIQALSVTEVKRVIHEQQPDIIHAHDMRASFVAARACGNIPLISHVHNNNFDSRGLSAKSIAYLLAAMKAKHIFWVSESSFNGYAFHKCFEKKSTVLYNIIDVDALYRRMSEDDNAYDYDVLYVGRLTYQKNPQRLMRVFEKVASKLPDVKIGIIGAGDLEKEIVALCEELHLQKQVTFLGFQANPLKMLHDAKMMIMTSRWEGTPMCALEAMALGVPIVSTPTDGLCELITDGENGFLSDDDDVLVQKVADIITDSSLHSALSEKTKEMARQLNEVAPYREKIRRAYENCFEK
ncbi:MAG: glycosyltransferase [Ruminococcaceae bacterium]|nr:glycosyltransferase [Oscillospiraceae bacterium]